MPQIEAALASISRVERVLWGRYLRMAFVRRTPKTLATLQEGGVAYAAQRMSGLLWLLCSVIFGLSFTVNIFIAREGLVEAAHGFEILTGICWCSGVARLLSAARSRARFRASVVESATVPDPPSPG
jgi:hypothetical protein